MDGTERKPTGIDGLDRLIHGGFPVGSTTLLIGTPGTGKSTFCKQFLYEGLKTGETAIVIISAQSPDIFVRTMKEMGWDIIPYLKKISFVDLYSWRTGQPTESSKKTCDLLAGCNIVSLNDLNDLNKCIKDLLEQGNHKNIHVVIDSISDLLLYEKSDSIFKCMQLLVAKIRSKKAVAVVTLEEGMHHTEHQNTLEYIFDNLLEMKLEKGKRFMRIRKVIFTQHPINWIEYKIEGGIQMKVSPVFK